MDIENNQQNGEYLESSNSINKLLTLKSLITDILLSNSAYDCMPINSAMCSIDKSVPFFNAINIMVNEDIEELLVWDQDQSKWIWMITLADIIRFIMHSIKCVGKKLPINFLNFQEIREEDAPIIDKQQLQQIKVELNKKSIGDIISEFNKDVSGRRSYIRLKSVVKQAKLSYIVLTMIIEKIHRIIIEDVDSRMMISIISFKDILLFLLRIANESSTELYSNVPINSLLQTNCLKDKFIFRDQKLIDAFRLMAETHRSLWLNVVDRDMQFCGMLFRKDYRELLRGWHLDWLWMTVGEFIDLKVTKEKSRIPEYRFFELQDTTKEIIWKIVMCRRNAIVCLNKTNNRVIATIGLMELFNLYVQSS